MFVYEVASGVISRSRNVGGQSTVLAMAPDGARCMAGFTLYDVITLAAVGQMNLANAPFQFPGSFNVQQNQGGSAFSPDGTTLYAAFNSAGFAIPQPRPTSFITRAGPIQRPGSRKRPAITMSQDLVSEGLRRSLDLPEAEWPAFLDSCCGGDAETRGHRERLLQRYLTLGLKMGPGVGVSTPPPPAPKPARSIPWRLLLGLFVALALAAWWFSFRS